MAESFFATFKLELVYQSQWHTRAQAQSEVFEYMERFYIANGGTRRSVTWVLPISNDAIMN